MFHENPLLFADEIEAVEGHPYVCSLREDFKNKKISIIQLMSETMWFAISMSQLETIKKHPEFKDLASAIRSGQIEKDLALDEIANMLFSNPNK